MTPCIKERVIMLWLVVLAASSGLVIGGLGWQYRHWLHVRSQRVSAESHIAQTSLGPVEYDQRGDGPTVLHFHGGNVGHNGWFMLAYLMDAGYCLLTPDRPGYLGTPLADNGSPAAQADLFAALLDTLGIDRVAVIGISAGGPGALQFASRYPHRTEAVVLLSAITRKVALSEAQLKSTLGRLVMSPRFQNVAYFLINQAMKRLPRLALQDYVRTETTYDMATGKRYIQQILEDPDQRQQMIALADAIVPALPRFDGVSNDIAVQQSLDDLPLDQVKAPTLIIHSQHDGDVPYENATYAEAQIPNAELITVEQFGHMVWWGDQAVTQDFQTRIEAFLRAHFAH